MVSELRTTIEPGDITAIEIECAKCHARHVRRVNAWHGTLLACANCNHPWMVPGSTDGKKLELLIGSLAALREFAESDQPQPYTIRLEIRNPKP